MDVTIKVEAKVKIGDAELAALKGASPENQLTTTRMLGGTVKSTVTVDLPPKPKAQPAAKEAK